MMKPSAVIGFFMLFIFAGLAAMSLFTDYLEYFLPGDRKYYFAGVLLLYAVVRAFRLRKQLRANKKQMI